jgi:peptidoglycan/xylan/chitin deacetylase (PgdA/CDA1 family)
LAIELMGRLLYYSGALFLIARLRRRFGPPRLLVPMYHRISADGRPDDALLDVEAGTNRRCFEQHLRVLRWFGALESLGEGFRRLHETPACCRTFVAITFDDGYRDNWANALAVLQRYGARATMFPVIRTTNGGRPLWWDELTQWLRHGTINGHGLAEQLRDIPELHPTPADDADVGSGAGRHAMARFLQRRLLSVPFRRREEVLDLLQRRVTGLGRPCDRLYMAWGELHDLVQAGMEIGGHTVDHPVLTTEPPAEQAWQIGQSRRVLCRELGTAVESFAYPNGCHDDAVCRQVLDAGFRVAVTTEHGVNYRHTDPYRLKRVPLGNERPFHLALKLAFYGWVW